MDNVTHTLTAVLLARAGLGKLVPGGTAVLMLASNLPDADSVVGLLGGPLAYLEYHRHLTHALVAAATAAVRPWRRPYWTQASGSVM